MSKEDMLKRRLAALKIMGVSDLQNKFRELFCFEAPQTNPTNLRMRLAWKIQETLLGGLGEDDMIKLSGLADADPLATLSDKSRRRTTILQGTRYEREWNGKIYQVTVCADGKFEYAGEFYRSLSAVASAITGTHWNGKKFFGVK